MAQIIISDFGLAANLPIRIVRNANAGRVRDPFEACCDIDSVAEDIVVIDNDVADMNTDTKLNSLRFRHMDIAVRHVTLHLHGATHRIYGTGKFRPACRRQWS